MARIKKCCPDCGSTNVKCDAWAWWNVDTQEWVLDDTYSNGWCDDCEGEFKTFDEVELPEERDES